MPSNYTINRTANAGRTQVVRADGRHPPVRPHSVDAVLVDTPCSGLGALGRRPDARWRARPGDIARLAALQGELVDAAVNLVRPGGAVVYAACTMIEAETVGIDSWLAGSRPELVPEPLGLDVWRPLGRAGGLVLPQDHDTDAMACFRYRVTGG